MPWYVAGPLITLIMLLLIFMDKNFGVSANLRTMCSVVGGGKFSDFFRFDWKSQTWNLIFALGMIVGGFISHKYLTNDHNVDLNPKTNEALTELGIYSNDSFAPTELFEINSGYNFVYLIIGGILIGFGARYAGGCTSGHAISGLSNLQLPSLIAVIGFFIGGLLMTHILLPVIL